MLNHNFDSKARAIGGFASRPRGRFLLHCERGHVLPEKCRTKVFVETCCDIGESHSVQQPYCGPAEYFDRYVQANSGLIVGVY
jgi:hypothetical protein